jgi:hypothetical protein
MEDFMSPEKAAIQLILNNQNKTSLNYAIPYCKAAMNMKEGTNEFKVQCIYILNNITHWFHPSARNVRMILKGVVKEYNKKE